ncbi:60 kDa SS-A/Ro ribonucleoprotein-like [Strongylocentrotus purpuratus]|uniref:TROVE domain-containing protein n=1 Tax=Strongylocentrotus purpuratus TaxID=7668 RepID=A0A7M7PMB6_STRPU|nr:60 kDa SS-A/Ro ribonucleoprotein-like [Strongylocentrotus purpuratus]
MASEGETNNIGINSDLVTLRRYLSMGQTSGTYYVVNKEPKENPLPECTQTILEEGRGGDIVKELVRFSKAGHVLHEESYMKVLVCVARSKDTSAKKAVYNELGQLCSTASGLFRFVDGVEKGGEGTGWGRMQRKAICNWYCSKDGQELARLVTGCKQRGGWSHRDLIRLAHVKPPAEGSGTAIVLKYIMRGLKNVLESHPSEGADDSTRALTEFLRDVDGLRKEEDLERVAGLVEKHKLSPEHLPTKSLKSKDVWKALVPHLSVQSLLDNIVRLASMGLFKPKSPEVDVICRRLQTPSALSESHVHPFSVLMAQRIYRSKKVEKTKAHWEINKELMKALTEAYHKAFEVSEKTGKRYLLAVDVSSSMALSGVNGTRNIAAREAAATIAMMIAKKEEDSRVMGFTSELKEIPITANMKLEDAVKKMGELSMGQTDFAQPMLWAVKNKIAVDQFIMCTDCETFNGDVSAADALAQYRQAMKIDAKVAIVAMTSNSFSMANADDQSMLDIAGFNGHAAKLLQSMALNFQ